MRIVSLVPSLTHMLCDFGLRDKLVGCTGFCVRPTGLHKTVETVGGTKDPDLEKIAALEPTHILVNEEENKPEHIAALQRLAPTLVTFPKDPRDVPAMMREAGSFLGVPLAGAKFATRLETALARLAKASAARPSRSCLYFIWREPYMVAGKDTYIDALLTLAGYRNVAPAGDRYPTLTIEQMAACAPECLLLSSEPYPFRKRDAERLRTEWEGCPEIRKIDGQLFSWYGTLTIEAVEQLESLGKDGTGGPVWAVDGLAQPSMR